MPNRKGWRTSASIQVLAGVIIESERHGLRDNTCWEPSGIRIPTTVARGQRVPSVRTETDGEDWIWAYC